MREAFEGRAVCRRVDPEVFYPSERETTGPAAIRSARIRDARGWCAICPVRMACLSSALEEEGSRSVGYRHGVRGGLLPAERYILHKVQAGKKTTAEERAFAARVAPPGFLPDVA